MPHQCVRCNTMYDDGSQAILRGCSCGARLFFFIRKDKIKQAEELTKDLSTEQREQVEKDVFDLVGSNIDADEPVVLDIETIRVLQPGKYEIDLVHLLKKDPLVFKLDEGKYIIDLVESFKNLRKK
ncbi:MAG TPA: Zn-ribbon containing protein [Candidatus Nanoarchaeia archaeon]|nr:Zn-ribbon containing protein [Candidatus Nanoarchaeia archaeon]